MIHQDTKSFILCLALTGRYTSAKSVWRSLIIRWLLWCDGIEENKIPGYATCPPDAGKGYPRGLSQKSVTKLIRETKLTLEHGTVARKATNPLP